MKSSILLISMTTSSFFIPSDSFWIILLKFLFCSSELERFIDFELPMFMIFSLSSNLFILESAIGIDTFLLYFGDFGLVNSTSGGVTGSYFCFLPLFGDFFFLVLGDLVFSGFGDFCFSGLGDLFGDLDFFFSGFGDFYFSGFGDYLAFYCFS